MPNVKKIRGLNLPRTPWATSACCGRPLPLYVDVVCCVLYCLSQYWHIISTHFLTSSVMQALGVNCVLETFILNIRRGKYQFRRGRHPTDRHFMRKEETVKLISIFDVCVSVHHIWNWREVPTWCNNLFIIINNSYMFLSVCMPIFRSIGCIRCILLHMVFGTVKQNCALVSGFILCCSLCCVIVG